MMMMIIVYLCTYIRIRIRIILKIRVFLNEILRQTSPKIVSLSHRTWGGGVGFEIHMRRDNGQLSGQVRSLSDEISLLTTLSRVPPIIDPPTCTTQ